MAANHLKASIEGTIVFDRSEGERAADCMCCDGPHINGRSIELIEKGKPRPYAGEYNYDAIKYLDLE